MRQISFRLWFCLMGAMLALSACDSDTEYWLPGTWTGTVGHRDASFIFSEDRTGYMRIEGGDMGSFEWYFEDERYWNAPSGTIILDFGRGDRACITGSYADRRTITGNYFSYYEDYLDGYWEEGRSLDLRRSGY